MSIFQYVRAQLGDSLLERICRRHCENKQTFFELLQTMTGVKIIHQFEDGGYVIEGSWEAMERCHTVLYKYHAELCSEELADLADQQHYPLLSHHSASSLMGMGVLSSKKPSPDSASCVALEPITPNSTFSALTSAATAADTSLPLNTSIQSNQSDNEFSSITSSGSSRCLDLSLKSLSNGTSSLGGQITPTNAGTHLGGESTSPHTPNMGLTPISCISSVNGSFSNGLGGMMGVDNDDENDNVSVGGSSEYSNDSPIDVESNGSGTINNNSSNGLNLGLGLTPVAKTALDCLMDMKVEPGNVSKNMENGGSRFLSSPHSELLGLSQNGDCKNGDAIITSSTPRGLHNSANGRKLGGANQRRSSTSPSAASCGGLATGASQTSQFMPTKTDQTKVHPCPFCPVTLGSSMNLKKHIQRKHSTPLHKCDICGKAYGFVNDLREHKKIHFLNLPCNQCEKVFKSRRSLLGHLSIAHKDSGVPPPPPPPSATFPVAAVTSSSTLLTSPAVINESSMSNHNSTSSTTSVTSLTPPGPMNVNSLSWSLSAITNYFNAAGLDLEAAAAVAPSTSSDTKQCSIPPSVMAHNLLHDFDSSLLPTGEATAAASEAVLPTTPKPLSSTPAKTGGSVSPNPRNVNCFISNGGALNLTNKSENKSLSSSSSSSDERDSTSKSSVLEKLAGNNNNNAVSVSSAIPMEVSCQ